MVLVLIQISEYSENHGIECPTIAFLITFTLESFFENENQKENLYPTTGALCLLEFPHESITDLRAKGPCLV